MSDPREEDPDEDYAAWMAWQADEQIPKPTWQCEHCGRFYSERTAAAHGWCQQEQDRKDAEQAWPA